MTSSTDVRLTDEVMKSIQVNFATFKARHPDLVFDQNRIEQHSYAFPFHLLQEMEALGKVKNPKIPTANAGIFWSMIRRGRQFINRLAYACIRPFLSQQEEFNAFASMLAQTMIQIEQRVAQLEKDKKA